MKHLFSKNLKLVLSCIGCVVVAACGRASPEPVVEAIEFASSAIEDSQVIEVEGETCPAGRRLVRPDEARARSSALCSLLGSWDIARLAGGGSMDGPGYGCHVRDSDARGLGHALCTSEPLSVIALRSFSGHYVVAEGGGGGVVNANRTAIGPWERFTVIDLNGGALNNGDIIALQAMTGQYLQAYGGGNDAMKADPWAIGPWEQFTVVDMNGGTVNQGDSIALRSFSGHYAVAEGGGGGVVNVNRTAIGPWERLTLLFQ
jgi:hypothetical protein